MCQSLRPILPPSITLALLVASADTQLKPPVAPICPEIDTYFGTTVTDPYRWMEAGGPELLGYMKAENDVTEETLKPFASQDAAFLAELKKIADTVPAVSGAARTLDQYFYLETPPGKNAAQLMTRSVAGGAERPLLDT